MKITQLKWEVDDWVFIDDKPLISPQICLVFGTRETIENNSAYHPKLLDYFPKSEIVIASTAGNILDEELIDDSIIATCIEFEKSKVRTFIRNYDEEDSTIIGLNLGKEVKQDDLAYVLLIGTSGINVGNFLNGLNREIGGEVPISGGIAGDNFDFEKTIAGLNGNVGEKRMIAIAFYGSNLHTYHGSKGGWDTFGPERTVTKADGNLLYEIDGQEVLELYKTYLGEKSGELPGAALYFPLAIVDPETKEYIVRGVQNTLEEENALVLFGDVKEGDTIQLMKANYDRVIEGASDSAKQAIRKNFGDPDLSILISCVARRLVLDQLVEEELSEAKSYLGKGVTICGFYSYSELSPIVGDNTCHLHNQTMTITSFYER